jgi:septal ring factor EnvC (AmiA/AmiB activator)
MIRDLEAAQKELDLLITRLVRQKERARAARPKPTGGGVFDKRKGSLPWPVNGPVVRGYGKVVHPVYHTVTMNNGIDISARPGVKVLCVASGSVVYVGRVRGLGTFAVVEHSGGYLSIYGHLGQVAVALNQELSAGALVGTVEERATAESVLHFELRKGAESLNPTEWLEDRK